jgi:hypothetical protein
MGPANSRRHNRPLSKRIVVLQRQGELFRILFLTGRSFPRAIATSAFDLLKEWTRSGSHRSSRLQEIIRKSVRSWQSRIKELCPFFKEEVLSTSQLQPSSFEVSWKGTWVPLQLLWLDSLGKAWPGVNIEYYDVLNRYSF